MSIQNPNCLVNLSHKFGVAPELTFDLIKKAADMGLNVKGICFHCGSQNQNALKYIEALEYCRDICRKAALHGIGIEIIDIGGGFPDRLPGAGHAAGRILRPDHRISRTIFFKLPYHRRTWKGPVWAVHDLGFPRDRPIDAQRGLVVLLR